MRDNVKDLGPLIVDLNDVYGRTLPGAIVLVDIYFILHKTALGNPLTEFLGKFYESTTVLFAIAFVLVSFVMGHMPLYLMFCFLGRKFGKSPKQLLSKIDLTTDERVKNFFEQQFSESALADNKGQVPHFCKHSLLHSHSNLYNASRARETRRNLLAGLTFSYVFTAVVFVIYGQFLFFGVFLLCAGISLSGFFRDLEAEDKEIIWSYYHTMHGQQSGDMTNKP